MLGKRSTVPVSIRIVLLYIAFGPSHSEDQVKVKACDLTTNSHQVNGTVYATEDYELMVEHFTYDGLGPDVFFYVGTSGEPSGSGILIQADNTTSGDPLGAYNNEIVTMTLPVLAREVAWISVWCRQFGVDFGSCHFYNPAKPGLLTQITSSSLP